MWQMITLEVPAKTNIFTRTEINRTTYCLKGVSADVIIFIVLDTLSVFLGTKFLLVCKMRGASEPTQL